MIFLITTPAVQYNAYNDYYKRLARKRIEDYAEKLERTSGFGIISCRPQTLGYRSTSARAAAILIGRPQPDGCGKKRHRTGTNNNKRHYHDGEKKSRQL